MARGYSDEMHRERWQDDDRERSRYGHEREEDRGFFERAGDEIRSWFGGEDPDRRYEEDRPRGSTWNRDRDYSRSGTPRSSSWYGEGRSPRGIGTPDRDRESGYGRMSGRRPEYTGRNYFGTMGQGGIGRSGSGWDRDEDRGYGPSRGRGSWMGSDDPERTRRDTEDRDRFRGQRVRRDHPQRWGEANRGENEELGYSELGYAEFAGTLGGFGNQTFGSSQDDHYRSWRDRQMADLDRDYNDYCREREQQFHQDFNSWRRNRQRAEGSPGSGMTGETASNAGVGTTTATTTGTGGAGSAGGSPTGTSGSIQADTAESTETSSSGGSGNSRSSSRSRS